MVTSANYLMSDLYVMDDMFDPTSGPSPKPDKNEEEEEEEEEDREQEQVSRYNPLMLNPHAAGG